VEAVMPGKTTSLVVGTHREVLGVEARAEALVKSSSGLVVASMTEEAEINPNHSKSKSQHSSSTTCTRENKVTHQVQLIQKVA
jgi:hypothetical protein